MHSRALHHGLLAMVILAGAGCAGGLGDRFKAPDLQLDHFVIRGLGISGGTLDLVLDVYNPNDFTLQGTKLRVGVDVEKSHVGDIVYEDDFAVARQDTTRITLPIKFQWAGVGSAVRTALGYGDIPYTLNGVAELETPFGKKKVPFTRSGRAPLTRASGDVGIPGKSP